MRPALSAGMSVSQTDSADISRQTVPLCPDPICEALMQQVPVVPVNRGKSNEPMLLQLLGMAGVQRCYPDASGGVSWG